MRRKAPTPSGPSIVANHVPPCHGRNGSKPCREETLGCAGRAYESTYVARQHALAVMAARAVSETRVAVRAPVSKTARMDKSAGCFGNNWPGGARRFSKTARMGKRAGCFGNEGCPTGLLFSKTARTVSDASCFGNGSRPAGPLLSNTARAAHGPRANKRRAATARGRNGLAAIAAQPRGAGRAWAERQNFVLYL